MSDYPDALVRRIAWTLANSNGTDWDYNPDDAEDVYRRDAVAVLAELGLREEKGQHFARVSDGWDQIVNQRRYVTDWEDA